MRKGFLGVLSFALAVLTSLAQPVSGPLVSTNRGVPVFTQTNGKKIDPSPVYIDATGNLYFGGPGTVIVNDMTTAERNLLSATNGMVIYNTTDAKLQVRENGSWVDIGSGTGVFMSNFDQDWFRTNGAIVRPALTKTLPSWINVTDVAYGAVGNGTDQTVPIKAAYDAIDKTTGGTLYFPPGRFKFSLTITNNNIRIMGSGAVKDYTTNVVSWFEPVDAVTPVIQVGDGANFARGFVIESATFFGGISGTNGHVGINLAGGAYEGVLRDVVLLNFHTNILAMATGILPCSLINLENVVMQPLAGQPNARGLYIFNPDNSNPYTTAINWSSGHLNGPTGAGSYAIEVDGTYVNLGESFYLDASTGKGIKLSKSGVGQFEPLIISSGFALDMGGNNVGITMHDNSSPYDKVVGPIVTTAKSQLLNGETYDIPRLYLSPNDRLANAVVQANLYFNRQNTFTNTGQTYIYGDTSDGFNIQSGDNVWLRPILGKDVVIRPGNLLLDNNKGIWIVGTNGVYEFTVFTDANNNTLIASPSSGGILGLVARNITNSISMDVGDEGIDLQVNDGSVIINGTLSAILNASDLASGTVAEARLATLNFSKLTAGQNDQLLTNGNQFLSASVKELQGYSQSTTYSWDLDGNRSQFLALTNNTTVSFANVPTVTNVAEFFSLTITNTGAFTLGVTEPANGEWLGGEPVIGAGQEVFINAFWTGYRLALWSSADGMTLAHFNTNQFFTNNATWPIAIKANAAFTNIAFPATQTSSANTNTLDDYEEGTWTPTDGSVAALSFTSPTGSYVKVGKLVTAQFRVTYPVTASGNAVVIDGLPFTSDTVFDYQGGFITYTDAGVTMSIISWPNTTQISLYNNAGVIIINSALSAKTVRGTVIYHATQ